MADDWKSRVIDTVIFAASYALVVLLVNGKNTSGAFKQISVYSIVFGVFETAKTCFIKEKKEK